MPCRDQIDTAVPACRGCVDMIALDSNMSIPNCVAGCTQHLLQCRSVPSASSWRPFCQATVVIDYRNDSHCARMEGERCEKPKYEVTEVLLRSSQCVPVLLLLRDRVDPLTLESAASSSRTWTPGLPNTSDTPAHIMLSGALKHALDPHAGSFGFVTLMRLSCESTALTLWLKQL